MVILMLTYLSFDAILTSSIVGIVVFRQMLIVKECPSSPVSCMFMYEQHLDGK